RRLAALLADFAVELRTMPLRRGNAALAACHAALDVWIRSTRLATLLADLLVEFGAVLFERRLAALASGLLIEFRAVPLQGRLAAFAPRFRDRHLAFAGLLSITFAFRHRPDSSAGLRSNAGL